jgi:hypothetical protein
MTRIMIRSLAVGALCALGACGRSGREATPGGDSTTTLMPGGKLEMSPYTKPDSTTGEINLHETGTGTNTPARPGGKAAGSAASAAAASDAARDSAARTRPKKP